MPELPEVEIVRRGLAPVMEGRNFACVRLNRANLRFPFPLDFASRLEGRRVSALRRRAKYIVAELDDGQVLAMHLGMTGRFTVVRGGAEETPGAFYYEGDADPRHDHVVFTMNSGRLIRYNDVRRFGYMVLLAPGQMEADPLFRGLGVEPLSAALSPPYLAGRAKDKAQPLKSFLLDQRIVAGLGNIYVCEALFKASLPPDAPARILAEGSNGEASAKALCESIRRVLEDAIRAGGSSLRDYRHADGGLGSFQEKFDVYGRAGQRCRNGCGALIARVVQQGRSTFFCPLCQAV